ncbi:hypothetical protein PsorP6_001428 [Peronosclerospora sorghi]|uniref:Uncharacterized protein n=1 Tax=Peronosclerospora sorghi TaxID=230839 RepID=A0ACC0WYD7_9STRA|nr:hypothetical protein PsorP6_001428 [Peronosclerospora sorghi]
MKNDATEKQGETEKFTILHVTTDELVQQNLIRTRRRLQRFMTDGWIAFPAQRSGGGGNQHSQRLNRLQVTSENNFPVY